MRPTNTPSSALVSLLQGYSLIISEEAVKAEGDFDKLCDSLRLCVEDLYRVCGSEDMYVYK